MPAARLDVAIDLTPLMPQGTGVDVYLHELVMHLGRVEARHRFHVFLNRADRARFAGQASDRLRLHALCPRPRPARLAFQQAALPAACAALGIDVLHSPSFLMPLARGRAAHVLTVQDMTFFSLPALHNRLRRSRPFRWAVMTSIRRADLINVPSRATRDALLAWAPGVDPERVRVTPLGVGPKFRPPSPAAADETRRRLGLPEHFVLFVGTLEPRKNLGVLVEAFRRLLAAGRNDAHLVLAGGTGWGSEGIVEALRAPGLAGRVHRVGFVDPDDLPALLGAARLFVYPSLYEGFGLPPLEAMACGTPVVAGRGSALEENLAGAAELVDPNDADALGDAIDRLLRDEALRERRRAAGLERAARFSWDALARDVVACYEQAAGLRGQRI